MLEHAALLLERCRAFPPGTDGDAATLVPARLLREVGGTAVGAAGWRRKWPRWLSRLRRPVLAVHEIEDAPLLCTVHRRWGLAPHWEVRDADGNAVGRLYGALVKDRFGRGLAVAEGGAGAPLRVRDLEGRELMTLHEEEAVARLTFGPAAAGNPFLKMLLLALALVRP